MNPGATQSPDLSDLREQLVRAVRRACPSWLAADADDLVQAAMMKLMEIIRRGEGNVELSPFYVRRTAYSAVVDEIRRRRRRGEVPLEPEEGEMERPAPLPDPESRSSGREMGRAIRRCLAELIRPRRLAVSLHLQGHRTKEVGELMGWSAKRAENLIYRGLADLRGCLEGKGFGP